MKRFLISEKFSTGSVLQLLAADYFDELKHMGKVLRLKVGDTVAICDGEGLDGTAEILRLDHDGAELKVISLSAQKQSGIELILVQAQLKGPKMDWLVEKITECGVKELWPIQSEFTVSHSDEGSGRLERWARITKAALKQSGSGFLPTIKPPQNFASVLEIAKKLAAPAIVLHPSENTPALIKVLTTYKDEIRKQGKLLLFVGPEGGFSASEVKLMEAEHFHFAGLGNSIFRGESAGLIASAIAIHFIDFS